MAFTLERNDKIPYLAKCLSTAQRLFTEGCPERSVIEGSIYAGIFVCCVVGWLK